MQNLICTDVDTVATTLSYTITPANSHFQMSGSEIQTTGTPLDYESATSQSVRIQVEDAGGVLFDMATVIVTVRYLEYKAFRGKRPAILDKAPAPSAYNYNRD